jgi:hypothetical protein
MATRHEVNAGWVVESEDGITLDEAGTAVQHFMQSFNRDGIPTLDVELTRHRTPKPKDAPDDWTPPKINVTVTMTAYGAYLNREYGAPLNEGGE